jgi:hypothetical protein
VGARVSGTPLSPAVGRAPRLRAGAGGPVLERSWQRQGVGTAPPAPPREHEDHVRSPRRPADCRAGRRATQAGPLPPLTRFTNTPVPCRDCSTPAPPRTVTAPRAARPPPPLPPLLTGHVSSLPPVLIGHVLQLAPAAAVTPGAWLLPAEGSAGGPYSGLTTVQAMLPEKPLPVRAPGLCARVWSLCARLAVSPEP